MEDLFRSESVKEEIKDPVAAAFFKYDTVFTELSSKISLDRKNEKEELKKQIQSLKSQINNCRNVKNHKMVEVNKQKAEKRKKLKTQIMDLENKLEDIIMEEEGSKTSSEKLMSGRSSNK